MSTDVKTSDLVARAFEIREAVAQLNEQEKALKEELNNIKLLLFKIGPHLPKSKKTSNRIIHTIFI